jgi:hypothetical protein
MKLRRHRNALQVCVALSFTRCARNARSVSDSAQPSEGARAGPICALSQVKVKIPLG